MKTLVFILLTVLSLSATAQSQEKKPVFEVAALAKTANGSPCMQLEWSTGNEKADYFVVERSTDGKSFKQVALVFASEEAAFTDYKYRDKDYPSNCSAVYYRVGLVNGQKEMRCLPVKKVALATGNGYLPLQREEDLSRK